MEGLLIIKSKIGFILGIVLAVISMMGNILLSVYFPEKVFLLIIGYLLIGLGTVITLFSAAKGSDRDEDDRNIAKKAK